MLKLQALWEALWEVWRWEAPAMGKINIAIKRHSHTLHGNERTEWQKTANRYRFGASLWFVTSFGAGLLIILESLFIPQNGISWHSLFLVLLWSIIVPTAYCLGKKEILDLCYLAGMKINFR